MKYKIYLITNKITGSMYVGKTKQTIKERFKGHCKTNSRCPAVSDAIKKYGSENFWVDQIDSAETEKEINIKEVYWILVLNTLTPNGYNLQSGGNNWEIAQQVRKQWSVTRTGKKRPPMTEETKTKISNALKGHTFNTGSKRSEATKEKMSKAQKGKTISVEQRQKMSEVRKGKPSGRKGIKHNQETIEKIRQANLGKKGKPMTEENKKALSIANKTRIHAKGRVVSEETRQKISESNKKFWNKPENKKILSDRMLGNKINEGKTYSAERVEKAASKNRGRKASEEQKQKLREAQKKAWAEGKYKDRPLSGRALKAKEAGKFDL